MAEAGEPVREKARPAKRQRTVQVVTAAAAFPISTKPKKSPSQTSQPSSGSTASSSARQQKQSSSSSSSKQYLDWHDTVKEVRKFGAQGFVGQQKRDFEAEQYQQLTGRQKKGQLIPLPIVRGIRKKAAERAARQLEEAKAAGIVLPTKAKTATRQAKPKDDGFGSSRHGPTPSIGRVNKGVLTVKRKPV